jgi:hypothetical protein
MRLKGGGISAQTVASRSWWDASETGVVAVKLLIWLRVWRSYLVSRGSDVMILEGWDVIR